MNWFERLFVFCLFFSHFVEHKNSKRDLQHMAIVHYNTTGNMTNSVKGNLSNEHFQFPINSFQIFKNRWPICFLITKQLDIFVSVFQHEFTINYNSPSVFRICIVQPHLAHGAFLVTHFYFFTELFVCSLVFLPAEHRHLCACSQPSAEGEASGISRGRGHKQSLSLLLRAQFRTVLPSHFETVTASGETATLDQPVVQLNHSVRERL